MLLPRIITGFVLALITLAVVIYLPFKSFMILALLLMLAMSWEWGNLAPFKARREKLLYLLLVLMAATYFVYLVPAKIPLLMLTIFWVGSVAFLAHYPELPEHWHDSWLRAFLGLLALSAFVVGLIVVKSLSEPGAPWLLLMLLLVWGADIGAYFVGRFWGKNLLASQVSPSKTWEGVIGGLVLSYVVAGFFAYFDAIGGLSGAQLIAIVLGVNVFSIIGDLFISLLKRQIGRKDTGRILPGHGGFLDRLDGLLAVTPAFALWLLCYVQ